MRILSGTSGFAFKEWKGPFYPKELKDADMLSYYATRFPTVEINNTFYRMPRESVLQDWASKVPDGFTFAVKASQRITHFARLKPEALESVEYLVRATGNLGERMGPLLLQLPPNMKRDMERLRAFLAMIPEGRRYAMEFRHDSWFGDDLVELLREHNVAMVACEQEDFSSPVHATTTWGYFRLHRFDYGDDALRAWADRILGLGLREAFVYFKHDHIPDSSGSGPLAVEAFQAICAV